MEVTIATLIKDRVFHVMCDDENVTWDAFSQTVMNYFYQNYQGVPFTFMNNHIKYGNSMIVVIDINKLPKIQQQIVLP